MGRAYIRGAGIHATDTIGMVNKTGSWRYSRPVHEEKVPPCNDACPAGNNIQGFLRLIREEKVLDAWRLIKETSPLPGVCGRVCPHPCEKECNRGKQDESMAVHALERMVADYAFDERVVDKPAVAAGKERVAVVGSGPAGLSCAYFLARDGYQVTVFESLPALGGMLRVGIPKYRLPREILDKEIGDIEALGVVFKTNARIGSITDVKDYDAAFVATGAHCSRALGVAGEDAGGVISGTEFLRKLNQDGDAQVGKNVVVIGGGNTAIDAARSALRLGAKSTIVYRRGRNEMPAVEEEIEGALAEGIEIVYLAAPTKVVAQEGKVREVEFTRMQLGEPDETGRKRPVPIDGSTFTMQVDMVITAIGETPDLSLLPGGVELRETGTKVDGMHVFGGGDAVTGAGRVADAIASGRRAAQHINRCLRGQEVEQRLAKELAALDDINTAYFPRQGVLCWVGGLMCELPVGERTSSFAEINLGVSLDEGTREATRCFSCGVCRECDNCVNFCPDICVAATDGSYEFDYDYCKGCGICSHECPAGVIRMATEA